MKESSSSYKLGYKIYLKLIYKYLLYDMHSELTQKKIAYMERSLMSMKKLLW